MPVVKRVYRRKRAVVPASRSVKRTYAVRRRPAYGYSRIRGRGSYWKDIQGVGSDVLKVASGNKTAESFGQKYGAKVGGFLGRLFKRLTGFGAYKVSSNSMMPSSNKADAPLGFGDGRAHIYHNEYVSDVVSSTNLASDPSVSSFILTPTNQSLFSWLPQIATAYQEWELLGCVVEFRSLSADWNGSSLALGRVVIATEYDVNKPNFVSIQQAENADYTTSCKPNEDMVHPIECAPRKNPLRTFYMPNANGTLPTNAEPNMYELANIQVLTSGFASANQIVGELHIVYHIALSKPITPITVPTQCELHYVITSATEAAPLGAAEVAENQGNESAFLKDANVSFTGSGTVMTILGLPIGTDVKLDYLITGTSATIGNFAGSLSAVGATALDAFAYNGADKGTYVQAPDATVASTALMASWGWTTTSASVVFTFAGNIVIPTAPNGCDLFISVLNATSAGAV